MPGFAKVFNPAHVVVHSSRMIPGCVCAPVMDPDQPVTLCEEILSLFEKPCQVTIEQRETQMIEPTPTVHPSPTANPSTSVKAVDGFFTMTPRAEQTFRQFKLTPSSWSEFQHKMDDAAACGKDIKVVYFVRHGVGLHNEAVEKYGVERWYKKLVTSDTYRDAELTPFGVQDAQLKGPPSIKAEMERGMPPIERVVVSPMSRAIQTAQNFFAKDQVPNAPFKCIESCREALGVDTCNNRRPLSELKVKFPDVDFSAVADEEDVLWTTERRESAEEIQARARNFLSELFRTVPERYVAVVTHFGFIDAVCTVTLGTRIETGNCEVVPLVLEAI